MRYYCNVNDENILLRKLSEFVSWSLLCVCWMCCCRMKVEVEDPSMILYTVFTFLMFLYTVEEFYSITVVS